MSNVRQDFKQAVNNEVRARQPRRRPSRNNQESMLAKTHHSIIDGGKDMFIAPSDRLSALLDKAIKDCSSGIMRKEDGRSGPSL